MVKLNKTPVRTANNFGINDIELELNIPEVKKYNNITIMGYDMDDVAVIRNNIESEKMRYDILRSCCILRSTKE